MRSRSASLADRRDADAELDRHSNSHLQHDWGIRLAHVRGMFIPASSPHLLPRTRLDGRRLLVCLDRSLFAEACIPYAVLLANTFGSAVTLAHVMQPPPERDGPQTSDALGWEISRQEARGYLERLARQVSDTLGRVVDIRLEQGRAAERILDLALELKADVTLLGSRGQGDGPAWNLGGTVQQVLAAARTSVFVAHSAPGVPSAPTPQRILVPLDGSLRTESVLPAVARIASANGAEVLLVHVVHEPLQTALLSAPEDLRLAQTLAARLESNALRYLEDLGHKMATDVRSVRTIVRRDANEHHGLLEISEREHADLIVLSAHGSGCDSARSFGSITTYLLTHSSAPLLVLQDLRQNDLHLGQDPEAQQAPPSPRASATGNA